MFFRTLTGSFACQFSLLAALALVTAGCGRRDIELVTVAGRVTLDGKPPPGPGTIGFAPVEALGGQPRRPATAHFGSDGQFRAQSFDPGDGLAPARYQVCVHCWQVAPTTDGPPAVSFIPARYMSYGSSGLELVVKPGASQVEWNAELTSP
jgi:hypothetical protein